MRFARSLRSHAGRLRPLLPRGPRRADRLLIEPLERRGMLAVAIGDLAADPFATCAAPVEDAAVAEFAADPAAWSAGLPDGVSLTLRGPDEGWDNVEIAPIAPTGRDEIMAEDEVAEGFGGMLDLDGPQICVLPVPPIVVCEPPVWQDADPLTPSAFDLGPVEFEGGELDPVLVVCTFANPPPTGDLPETPDETPDPDSVIVDETFAAADTIAGEQTVVDFQPVDYRVQFVVSDPGWAAYFYLIGPDDGLVDLSVVASYDEPTIAAFVADHSDDAAVRVADFDGRGWWVSGFPLELAPPVPASSVFASWEMDAEKPRDETFLVNGAETVGDYGGVVWSIDDRLRTFDGPVSTAASDGLPNEERVVSTAEFGGFRGADAVAGQPASRRGDSSAMQAMAAVAPWFGQQAAESEAGRPAGVRRRSR